MIFRVELSVRAMRDIEILYLEKDAAGSSTAVRWFNGLERAVYGLSSRPQRCPLAPEGRRAKRKLRHLLYGKPRNIYRVIYEIDETRRVVWVITIRHGARGDRRPSDLV